MPASRTRAPLPQDVTERIDEVREALLALAAAIEDEFPPVPAGPPPVPESEVTDVEELVTATAQRLADGLEHRLRNDLRDFLVRATADRRGEAFADFDRAEFVKTVVDRIEKRSERNGTHTWIGTLAIGEEVRAALSVLRSAALGKGE